MKKPYRVNVSIENVDSDVSVAYKELKDGETMPIIEVNALVMTDTKADMHEKLGQTLITLGQTLLNNK